MKSVLRLVAFVLVWGVSAAASGQEAVSLPRQDGKPVPVMTYGPAPACRGVAIVSPGAGGSEEGYGYLGEALSSLGYLAVVVGHAESGRQALRDHRQGKGLRAGLASLTTDPEAYRGRFRDIAAAREWAQARCTAGKVILLGHSMGAATTLIEAGARNRLGLRGTDAFQAYVALSPQGAGSIFPVEAWADLRRPVLTLTGTRDDELGGASWEVRTEPYRNMPAGCKWLGVIDGATHANFAGHGRSRRTEALTVQVITAFLAGVERGDCTLPAPLPGLTLQGK